MHGTNAALTVCYGLVEHTGHVSDELLWQGEGLVVVDDGGLDLFGGQVRQVAYAVLAATAQEVVIDTATAPLGFDVDKPTGAFVAFAAVTEQIALEVVLEDAVTLAVGAANIYDVLHPVKKLWLDNCLVAPRIDLSLVRDIPDVVRVSEHPVQPLERHGAFRPTAVGSGGQAKVGHRGFKAFQGVIATRVQLEDFLDERRALFINIDGVDLLAFVLDTHINITESGLPESAAVDGLMTHLGGDVETLQGILQAVHDVEHAFHCYCMRSFTEVFFGGDEPDTNLLQLNLQDGRIEVVAEGAGAHIDDQIVNIWMLLQILHNLPDDRALVDRFTGVARLDELFFHIGVEGFRLSVVVVALSSNREPVFINICCCVRLTLGGHPQQ
ncbi:hypothetical protein NG2371_04160 [Nocardia gamkensis]|nr:hypothetical protein [Nocardia gamkensis]